MLNSIRLVKEDVNKPCKELAIYLLGKILVRKLHDGTVLKGKIVETECYLGGEDKASHSYNNRRSIANEPMYMPAGTTYVYMTYGMYHCFNISSEEPGAAVLIRALEPIDGIEIMKTFRAKRNNSSLNKFTKISQICNGPSKLCIAMDITKSNLNKLDMTNLENQELWLEDDPDFDKTNIRVVHSSRIGISNAGEWTTKPLRYYILNNECVSKRDKVAENLFN